MPPRLLDEPVLAAGVHAMRTLGDRARGLAHLWGRPGPLRRLVAAGVAYLDPRYDPARRDVAALVEEYRARLFGPGGALAAA